MAKRANLSSKAKRAVLLKQGDCCYYCQQPFGTTILRGRRAVVLVATWDHMAPYAYIQCNPTENFVAACQLCNGWKGSKIFPSFHDLLVHLQQRWEKTNGKIDGFSELTRKDHDSRKYGDGPQPLKPTHCRKPRKFISTKKYRPPKPTKTRWCCRCGKCEVKNKQKLCMGCKDERKIERELAMATMEPATKAAKKYYEADAAMERIDELEGIISEIKGAAERNPFHFQSAWVIEILKKHGC